MPGKIRVAILGVCGRMGREVVKAVSGAPDMELVGACDIAQGASVPGLDLPIETDFEAMLDSSKPAVVVDFAKPFVMENTRIMLRRGVVPIVGTTGQTPEELAEIGKLAEAAGTPAMVVPNFAIGAVLMMKFAAQAAEHMPNVEIIELHLDKKLDSPSGTAIKTAEMIEKARKAAAVEADRPAGANDPARGDERAGVHIHSVRLPGLVAHQEVIFGGVGQTLTIKHDSFGLTSFMPGVLLAVRRAAQVRGLIYGLDKLL